jgi:hypothetical protein
MLTNWLRKVLFGGTRCRPQRRPARRGDRGSFKPGVEGLEDRQMLSASALFAASAVAKDAVWYSLGGGALFEHVGTFPNDTVSSVAIPNGIAQISAGKGSGGQDAAFVLDGDNIVFEVVRSGNTLSAQALVSPVLAISASAVSPDTVFAVSAIDHSIHEFVKGIGVHDYALGAPTNLYGAQPSQISAGKDGATGTAAVFANFNGAVYEHTASGWSYVTGVNLSAPHSIWQTFQAVGDFSASQVAGDTVFTVNLFGDLSESIGYHSMPNTPPAYFSLSVGSGVSQVSAGVDANGGVAAFTLTGSGSLDEYTVSGLFSYAKAHVADYATAIDASQVQGNTVYYSIGSWPALGSELLEHSGQSVQLISAIIG